MIRFEKWKTFQPPPPTPHKKEEKTFALFHAIPIIFSEPHYHPFDLTNNITENKVLLTQIYEEPPIISCQESLWKVSFRGKKKKTFSRRSQLTAFKFLSYSRKSQSHRRQTVSRGKGGWGRASVPYMQKDWLEMTRSNHSNQIERFINRT